jgi:HAD superfamily hydrolase (TIGR01490 family)
MKVAFFDLDGTLLDGDTDVMWSHVLTSKGVFSAEAADEFQRAYSSGQHDAAGFVARFLAPIRDCGLDKCTEWREETLRQHVIPHLSQKIIHELNSHRALGHELVLATATNEFLVAPIAAHLAIGEVLASPAERVAGDYTGLIGGAPCFKEEKLRRARAWVEERGHSWSSTETWFYSDSQHDLPLLSAVTHPIAVSPDDELAAHALREAWPVVSIHSGEPTSTLDKPEHSSTSDSSSDDSPR